LIASPDARLEFGRVLTLLSEVQYRRTAVGKLAGPLATMRQCMTGVKMHSRPEELGGEAYGEERATRIRRLIAELRGDAVINDDDNDEKE
jgi:hypothetical protein